MVTTTTNLSPNRYTGRGAPITLIGIHTMEAPESAYTAESVSAYFKNPVVEASAHWCVDADSRVRCVNDEDAAWTMPPVNDRSLNLEFAGYAAQTSAQWGDPYSVSMLGIGALCVAEWCDKYAIPIRHLTDAQIRAGEKGLVGHVDVNRAFQGAGGTDHTDPGPNFPWSYFLQLVANHHTVVGSSIEKPSCVALQLSIHTTPDNQWGSNTDKHCDALVAASIWGGNAFPYGVQFTQGVVGATPDGVWGPKSAASHTATVRAVQTDLKAMGFNPGYVDGIWGTLTNAAYEAARQVCHI